MVSRVLSSICGQHRRFNAEDVLPVWAREMLTEVMGQPPPKFHLHMCEFCNPRPVHSAEGDPG